MARREWWEPTDGHIIPIAIREDCVARIHIPDDLTADEAEKIARVVKAYASPTQAQETER